MPDYYTCSYGGIVLDAITISDDMGRALLTLEPASGQGGKLLDRGQRLRRSRVRIRFVRRDHADNPLHRRRALAALADGQSRLFRHPVDGTWPAKIGDIQAEREKGIDILDVTFLEDRDSNLAPQGPGPGALPRAGADTVRVQAARTDATLATLGERTHVTAAAVDLAETWQTATPIEARQVYTDLAGVTAAIDTEITRLDASHDLARFPAWVALQELASELGRAGAAATAETAATFELVLGQPTNLLALCATTYGAADCIQRYQQARALNRIDTPLSVPAGTRLVLPLVK